MPLSDEMFDWVDETGTPEEQSIVYGYLRCWLHSEDGTRALHSEAERHAEIADRLDT